MKGENLSVTNRDISEEERKGRKGRAMMEEHPLWMNKKMQETRQCWFLSRTELGYFVSSVSPTPEGAALSGVTIISLATAFSLGSYFISLATAWASLFYCHHSC